MKKFARVFCSAALTLAMAVGGGVAAGERLPAVQIDGRDVVFTDALPQIRQDRTFLPFRNVFESMGAEVSYTTATDTQPATVTGSRDGRTVTMVLGSKEVTVTEPDGTTATFEMDVEPYADPETWRTYVPVRFAAQAMGANVGWDQDAYTVIIVDTAKQVEAALEGRSFTWLEKLAGYLDSYDRGTWRLDENLTGTISLDLSSAGLSSSLAIPLSVRTASLTENGENLQAKVNIAPDLTSLESLMYLVSGDIAPSETTQQIGTALSALAQDGLDLEVRLNGAGEMLYLNFDPAVLNELLAALGMTELSIDPNMWFSLNLSDVAQAAAATETDSVKLMDQIQKVDYTAMLTEAMGKADLNDANEDYASYSDLLNQLVGFLSDDNFVQNGNVYVSKLEGTDLPMTATISLGTQGDAVSSFALALDLPDATLRLSQDENRLSGTIAINLPDLLQLDISLDGSYSQATESPAVVPPAEAAVVDLAGVASALMNPNR